MENYKSSELEKRDERGNSGEEIDSGIIWPKDVNM